MCMPATLGYLRTRVMDACKLSCGCWESNPGPLDEWSMLLTMASSLLAPFQLSIWEDILKQETHKEVGSTYNLNGYRDIWDNSKVSVFSRVLTLFNFLRNGVIKNTSVNNLIRNIFVVLRALKAKEDKKDHNKKYSTFMAVITGFCS